MEKLFKSESKEAGRILPIVLCLLACLGVAVVCFSQSAATEGGGSTAHVAGDVFTAAGGASVSKSGNTVTITAAGTSITNNFVTQAMQTNYVAGATNTIAGASITGTASDSIYPNAVLRDGSRAMLGDFDLGGFRIGNATWLSVGTNVMSGPYRALVSGSGGMHIRQVVTNTQLGDGLSMSVQQGGATVGWQPRREGAGADPPTTHAFTLWNGSSTIEILTLRHTSRVGIMTATPSATLDVVGNVNCSTGYNMAGSGGITGVQTNYFAGYTNYLTISGGIITGLSYVGTPP